LGGRHFPGNSFWTIFGGRGKDRTVLETGHNDEGHSWFILETVSQDTFNGRRDLPLGVEQFNRLKYDSVRNSGQLRIEKFSRTKDTIIGATRGGEWSLKSSAVNAAPQMANDLRFSVPQIEKELRGLTFPKLEINTDALHRCF